MRPGNPTRQFPLALSENYEEPIEVKMGVTVFEEGHSKRWEHGKRGHTCVWGGREQRRVGEKPCTYVGWRQYVTPERRLTSNKKKKNKKQKTPWF
jgi:hypothetical protein